MNIKKEIFIVLMVVTAMISYILGLARWRHEQDESFTKNVVVITNK